MKNINTVVRLNFKDSPRGKISRYQFEIAADGLGNSIYIPVIVARGKEDGPILGITAVIHGNELNGLPVIQRVMREIEISNLRGTVIAVPVVNVPGFLQGSREFSDLIDLNHVMPGKEFGNQSNIFSHRFFERIVNQFDYLIDLHTASFGRINSYYIRADLNNPITKKMAELLNPEIILHNKGAPGTLRKAAMDKDIHTVTAELRDPYKFQKKIIRDATKGIQNILHYLNMQTKKPVYESEIKPIICKKSKWIYTNQGGLLSVVPTLLAKVKKGDVIARVRNVYGDVIAEYKSSEEGVVIGKSVNPVNQTGSRIIHLGDVKKE